MILCMHGFPVCLFNPAFRGCHNPINGLLIVRSLAHYAEQVYASVCPVRPLHAAAAGLLLWARRPAKYRSTAARPAVSISSMACSSKYWQLNTDLLARHCLCACLLHKYVSKNTNWTDEFQNHWSVLFHGILMILCQSETHRLELNSLSTTI